MGRRSAPPILLYLGVVLVAAALGLAGFGLYRQLRQQGLSLPWEEGSESAATEEAQAARNPLLPPKPTFHRPAPVPADTLPSATGDTLGEPLPQSGVEELDQPERLSRVEERLETQRILLARIEQTPQRLDPGWFLAVFQFVPEQSVLQAYYDSLLVLGEQRTAVREQTLKAAKEKITRDPKVFLGLARKELYATPQDSARLVDEGKGNLAVALFLELKLAERLEDADESLLAALFRDLQLTYEALGQLAVAAEQDPHPWLVERLRVLEATALDGYLRLTRYEAEQAAAMETDRPGRRPAAEVAAPQSPRGAELNKALDKSLLQLGKLYAEAVRIDSLDREGSRQNADRAFAVLAMVYRRTGSDLVLSTMSAVNQVQRGSLFRQARECWRRAQMAVARGDHPLAAEQYGLAFQRYEECLATAIGPEHDRIAGEQEVLQQEVAGWQARLSAAPPAAPPPQSPGR